MVGVDSGEAKAEAMEAAVWAVAVMVAEAPEVVAAAAAEMEVVCSAAVALAEEALVEAAMAVVAPAGVVSEAVA